MSYEDYEKAVKDPEDKTISEIALTTDGEKDFGFGMPRTFLNTDTLCDHKRKYVMGNWVSRWSLFRRDFVGSTCGARFMGD